MRPTVNIKTQNVPPRRPQTKDIMEKLSSTIAALNAGKLPTTRQLVDHIDWLELVLLPKMEPTAETAMELPQLTAQGKLLADDIRALLVAYKMVALHKNSMSFVSIIRGPFLTTRGRR